MKEEKKKRKAVASLEKALTIKIPNPGAAGLADGSQGGFFFYFWGFSSVPDMLGGGTQEARRRMTWRRKALSCRDGGVK